MGRIGCRYARVPERLLRELPPGELLILCLILSAWRPVGAMEISFRDVGEASGFCSRTAGAHVASLRRRGLVAEDRLRALPAARAALGERFAAVPIDRAGRVPPAAFRTFAWSRLYTDRHGRRRVSWRWLASAMQVSRRTVTANVAALRRSGVQLAARVFRRSEKTFPSLRKGSSAQSGNGVRKSGVTPSRRLARRLNRAEREAERLRQLRLLRLRMAKA